MRGERGQAAVELVVAGPLLVAVALLLAQVVLAVQAQLGVERAAAAARQAALQGDDPVAAAAAALPARGRIERRGSELLVELPLPALLPLAGWLPAAQARVSRTPPLEGA